MTKIGIMVAVAVLMILCSNIWYVSAVDENANLKVARNNLNGRTLIEMGEAMNSTLLRLLGNAFVNLEKDISKELCKITPREPWTSWGKCSAQSSGVFGFKTRSRTCWFEDEKCNKTGKQEVENENVLCEGYCPTTYTLYNSTGLCLRYFKDGVTQVAAENICATEGGHLLNTDTEERWEQAVSTAKTNGVNTLWLDGRRTTFGGEWMYLNGIDPETAGVTSKWLAGEPSNGSDELCKVLDMQSGSYTWCDRGCNYAYAYLCEVRE